MNISARRIEQATILDVSGNIDMSNSPVVRKALLQEIREKGVSRVLVNMTGVGYIDSSGVASLVEALKACRDLGLRLVLFGLTDPAREVFKISRLLKLFEVYEDEQQAIGS
jgi:anti-sigma B factor antagonist